MQDIVTVTQFNTAVKSVLQGLGLFSIKGEITELRISPNKGLFITLSDGKSNLKIGGYAPTVKGVDLIEKDMEVIVTGTPDIYVPYGNYSLAAVSIKPHGEGAQAIAYQKLKEKLEKEGLFEQQHKLELPKFVTKIALLTGIKSAAYSDFTKILEEHSSGIEVDFYPVLVQGAKSEAAILKTLDTVFSKNYDSVVLTRGGGSLEDLSSFNSEEIARKIFSSRIPVVVGVGHERDESIADFVSDMRASTPSQCAYYLLDQNTSFLEELNQSLEKRTRTIRDMFLQLEAGLDNFLIKINSYIANSIDKTRIALTNIDRLLDAYDYASVLKRGFSLIQKDDQRVKSAKNLQKKDNIDIIFSDGVVKAVVE